jgi:hypothetical protein
VLVPLLCMTQQWSTFVGDFSVPSRPPYPPCLSSGGGTRALVLDTLNLLVGTLGIGSGHLRHWRWAPKALKVGTQGTGGGHPKHADWYQRCGGGKPGWCTRGGHGFHYDHPRRRREPTGGACTGTASLCPSWAYVVLRLPQVPRRMWYCCCTH